MLTITCSLMSGCGAVHMVAARLGLALKRPWLVPRGQPHDNADYYMLVNEWVWCCAHGGC